MTSSHGWSPRYSAASNALELRGKHLDAASLAAPRSARGPALGSGDGVGERPSVLQKLAEELYVLWKLGTRMHQMAIGHDMGYGDMP